MTNYLTHSMEAKNKNLNYNRIMTPPMFQNPSGALIKKRNKMSHLQTSSRHTKLQSLPFRMMLTYVLDSTTI